MLRQYQHAAVGMFQNQMRPGLPLLPVAVLAQEAENLCGGGHGNDNFQRRDSALLILSFW